MRYFVIELLEFGERKLPRNKRLGGYKHYQNALNRLCRLKLGYIETEYKEVVACIQNGTVKEKARML